MSGLMKTAAQTAERASAASEGGKAYGQGTPTTKSERKAGRKNGVAPAAKSAQRKPPV
jgi:hypothetical protein